MRWSDIPRSPSSRVLRQFAAAFLVFFGAMAGWQGVVHGRITLALIIAMIAVLVGGLGLIRPQTFRPIFVGWMILAFPIGWTISLILLAVVYYGVFLPVGLFSRLAGRDPLQLKPGHEQASYWIPNPATIDIRRYFRSY